MTGEHAGRTTRVLSMSAKSIDSRTKVIVMSLGGEDIQPGESAGARRSRRRALRESAGVQRGSCGRQRRCGSADFPGKFPASFTVAALDGAGSSPDSARAVWAWTSPRRAATSSKAAWDGSAMADERYKLRGADRCGCARCNPFVSARHRSGRGRTIVCFAQLVRGRVPTLDASAALRAVGQGALVDNYRPVTAPSPAAASAAPASPGLRRP